ncbi:MAG TPA: AMP-binding protein [Saprospiraceae bacterium]|nr:AMP-binding protein [Saprospiraceae bacterium]
MTDSRPWLKHYPKGLPANIDVDQYPNLNSFLNEAMEKFADKTAFYCMGKTITYGEMDRASRQLAGYLQSRGLKPGDRVAIMMPNLLQYPIALFGCIRAGLVVVNTNPLYTPRELLFQLKDSGVRGIIIVENFASHLQEVIGETQVETVILTSIGELLGPVKGSIVNFVVRNVKRMVPKFSIANTVTFKEAIAQGKNFTIKPFEDEPDKVIAHQYTGGTTGVAKGAMLTNRNIVANMLQIKGCLDTRLKEGEEITLCPLPMYHIFAFIVNCLAMMSYGSMNVLVTNARDIKSVIKEFKNHRITVMTGVNSLYNAMLNVKEFAALDFSQFKFAVGGAMAVQKSVNDRWKVVTGSDLIEGYGMTEASPVVSVNPIDGTARIGTVGLPVPSTDIRIVDDNGIVQLTGQRGEVQVKGPQVMAGYYNKPVETANTIRDGWLCTGDIGIVDEDGFLSIVDRKKDMIIVSGFKVFPNEIEEVVCAHPKIKECAAVGIPNEKSGEVLKLFVVKKDKSLSKNELLEYCKENLTAYKMPKEIEFRDSLPKSNVGKILRRELREIKE